MVLVILQYGAKKLTSKKLIFLAWVPIKSIKKNIFFRVLGLQQKYIFFVFEIMSILERKREKALRIFDESRSHAKVRKATGMTKRTLDKWLQRREQGMGLRNSKGSGRPRRLTSQEWNRVRRMLTARNGRYNTTRRVAARISSSGRSVSHSTIVREVARHQLRSVRPVPKPYLTPQQQAMRLKWCEEHKSTSFTSVLFTDEAAFVQCGKGGLVYKPIGVKTYETPSFKFPLKVMVWGGVSLHGKTNLIFVPKGKTVNAATYQWILGRAITPTLRGRFGRHGIVLLHDGAPAHKARTTKQWLARHHIMVMENFPPNSPDLNIIENVWGVMKRRMYSARIFKTLRSLKAAVKREWANIGSSTLTSLVKNMPNRIQAVIDAQGGTTKY